MTINYTGGLQKTAGYAVEPRVRETVLQQGMHGAYLTVWFFIGYGHQAQGRLCLQLAQLPDMFPDVADSDRCGNKSEISDNVDGSVEIATYEGRHMYGEDDDENHQRQQVTGLLGPDVQNNGETGQQHGNAGEIHPEDAPGDREADYQRLKYISVYEMNNPLKH